MMSDAKDERKKLIVVVAIAALFITASSLAMNYYGTDVLLDLVRQYDLLGFVVLITVMNVVVQPISADFLIAGSSLFLDHSTTTVAVWSAVAGVLSGIIAYAGGKAIGLTGFDRYCGKRNAEKGRALYEKYGVWAIVLSAVTPIPYSLICWMAGIFRMPLRRFLLAITLTRAPRHVVVAFWGADIIRFLEGMGIG